VFLVFEAVVQFGVGPDQKGNALCYEHADQTFVSFQGPGLARPVSQ